jgi:hypothetical protein
MRAQRASDRTQLKRPDQRLVAGRAMPFSLTIGAARQMARIGWILGRCIRHEPVRYEAYRTRVAEPELGGHANP